MPQLRVKVGPSTHDRDLIPVCVNTNEAFAIRSDKFEGKIVVHIQGLPDEDGNVEDGRYFELRQNVTWSIQVQGRFLKPCTADDILFGNTFDRPLRLPWGSSFALKFMQMVDQTLKHDLSSSKPWALSPLVSTMPHLMFSSTSPNLYSPPTNSSASTIDSFQSRRAPVFPSKEHDLILDERSPMDITMRAKASSPDRKAGKKKNAADERRKFFRDEENRRKVVLGPEDTITTDFCYNFITFPDLHLSLASSGIPGTSNISFDLAKYWDGQPVRFVCCRRPKGGLESIGRGDGVDPEDVFWCVSIEKVE